MKIGTLDSVQSFDQTLSILFRIQIGGEITGSLKESNCETMFPFSFRPTLSIISRLTQVGNWVTKTSIINLMLFAPTSSSTPSEKNPNWIRRERERDWRIEITFDIGERGVFFLAFSSTGYFESLFLDFLFHLNRIEGVGL